MSTKTLAKQKIETVFATNDARKDTKNLLAVFKEINANPYSRFHLDSSKKRFILDGAELALINEGASSYQITNPFVISGLSTRVLFQNNARLIFGASESSSAPFTNGTSFTLASKKTNYIADTTLYNDVEVGDFVSVWSDDEITDNLPHNWLPNANPPSQPDDILGKQYPGQIVQVVDKKDNKVYFDTLFQDTYQTNAYWKKISLSEKMVFEGIDFKIEGATNNYSNMLVFGRVADVQLNRCSWVHEGEKGTSTVNGSYIALTNCSDVEINESIIRNQWAEGNLYGIGIFAGSKDIVIRGCEFAETRHPVTSGGYVIPGQPTGQGYHRGGTPTNVTVKGNKVFRGYTGLLAEGSLFALDTHSEGSNWLFDGNECYIGQPAFNNTQEIRAFQVRSRNTTLRNNRVYGHANCVGVDVQGTNCTVENHYQCGGLHMVRTQPVTDNQGGLWPVNGLMINGAIAEDIRGPIFEVQSGNNSTISGLRLKGTNSNINVPLVYIRYWDHLSAGMTGHRIFHCDLDKNGNDYAIDFHNMNPSDLRVSQCQLGGYGLNSWCDQGATQGPSFKSTYDSENYVS